MTCLGLTLAWGDVYCAGQREQAQAQGVSENSIPTEVSVPESKVARMSLAAGDTVRVKGEFDENRRFNLFALTAALRYFVGWGT